MIDKILIIDLNQNRMKNISRRGALKVIGLTTGATIGGLPAFAQLKTEQNKEKLKVLVIGAHPDDPESNCGGTMVLFANAGHEVVSAYLTSGEAGIEDASYEEAAKIRNAEVMEACRILKVRPEFIGQIDGSTEINSEQYIRMFDFIKKEDPDIVFTHWPVDAHRDHRVCSLLVYDAWLLLQRKFDLYYSESMTGDQSMNFHPTDYVDITTVISQKHEACFAHKSQKPEEWYFTSHGHMEKFRGMEYNCEYAEAFVRLFQKPGRSII